MKIYSKTIIKDFYTAHGVTRILVQLLSAINIESIMERKLIF